MPHFGLMEERKLGPVAGPLQRARLHIRAGKRRLRQGKISAGIVTLYDAVSAAMESYGATEGGAARLGYAAETESEKELYTRLVSAGVLDGSFDFGAFDRLTEEALSRELAVFDYEPLLAGIDALMKQLGVSPFDEARLPAEDPATF